MSKQPETATEMTAEMATNALDMICAWATDQMAEAYLGGNDDRAKAMRDVVRQVRWQAAAVKAVAVQESAPGCRCIEWGDLLLINAAGSRGGLRNLYIGQEKRLAAIAYADGSWTTKMPSGEMYSSRMVDVGYGGDINTAMRDALGNLPLIAWGLPPA